MPTKTLSKTKAVLEGCAGSDGRRKSLDALAIPRATAAAVASDTEKKQTRVRNKNIYIYNAMLVAPLIRSRTRSRTSSGAPPASTEMWSPVGGSPTRPPRPPSNENGHPNPHLPSMNGTNTPTKRAPSPPSAPGAISCCACKPSYLSLPTHP